RALAKNVLKNSPVPLIFILHGINPGEAPKFFREAEKLLPNEKIRLVVLTFGDSIFGRRADNVYPMYPPAYTPRDVREIPPRRKLAAHEPLTIGFFGQYRREKRLEDFLKVFEEGRYTRPVKLLVQGSTMHPEDAEDFERIIAAHQGDSRMEFLHKGLIGEEWQRAILGVDALLMPYSAPRYLYHWGGMLFTAIGCERPVVASDDINPEVFREFHIGETFRSGDMGDLKRVLEEFINGFDERADTYEQELRKAAEEFSPENFAGRLEQVMNNDNFRG
ncbi:MAG: glycosyltransferase, partial [Selenomonadaceae bacterium]|nr:glycosyltransferase [Selenomonadaceae bacterium]